eukprot:3421134-Prymnesium_polylepis.1
MSSAAGGAAILLECRRRTPDRLRRPLGHLDGNVSTPSRRRGAGDAARVSRDAVPRWARSGLAAVGRQGVAEVGRQGSNPAPHGRVRRCVLPAESFDPQCQ